MKNLKELITEEVIANLKNRLEILIEMEKNYPNDQDLGREIRKKLMEFTSTSNIYDHGKSKKNN